MKRKLIGQLDTTRKFFLCTIGCLTEEDASFAPTPEQFTVAQQIVHAAQTVSWFIDGAFDARGFDLNFEKLHDSVKQFSSLATAKTAFDEAFSKAIAAIENHSEAELLLPIAPGPIMGGEPRVAVVAAIADHTAHHRGALAVYCRLRQKIPAMPYSAQ